MSRSTETALRGALKKITDDLVQWMVSKNGDDWKERLPYWRDKMNPVEIMVFDMAVAGLKALALPPSGERVEYRTNGQACDKLPLVQIYAKQCGTPIETRTVSESPWVPLEYAK